MKDDRKLTGGPFSPGDPGGPGSPLIRKVDKYL